MTTGVLRFARTCIKPAFLNVHPTILVRFFEISHAVVWTCSRRYRVILDQRRSSIARAYTLGLVAVGFLRRSISRVSSNRPRPGPCFSTRVSVPTLCCLGQSNKAIGLESPIGPCIATLVVDNRQACCLRKRWAPSRQRNGIKGASKQSARPHSWAECREKK
jgi:hypothetical protein